MDIATGWEDSRSLAAAEKTVEAMRAGVPIITQGVLRDPQHRTYGMADLLVRSDVLAGLFPEDFSAEEAAEGAPGLGLDGRHYRVIDIKYRTLKLNADGTMGGRAKNARLSVTGVGLQHRARAHPGLRAARRLPAGPQLDATQGTRRGLPRAHRRVAMDGIFEKHDGASLGDLTLRAHRWIREVRQEGAEWEVLPLPTRPELYPHMRHDQDEPWHGAKRRIGA